MYYLQDTVLDLHLLTEPFVLLSSYIEQVPQSEDLQYPSAHAIWFLNKYQVNWFALRRLVVPISLFNSTLFVG